MSSAIFIVYGGFILYITCEASVSRLRRRMEYSPTTCEATLQVTAKLSGAHCAQTPKHLFLLFWIHLSERLLELLLRSLASDTNTRLPLVHFLLDLFGR